MLFIYINGNLELLYGFRQFQMKIHFDRNDFSIAIWGKFAARHSQKMIHTLYGIKRLLGYENHKRK